EVRAVFSVTDRARAGDAQSTDVMALQLGRVAFQYSQRALHRRFCEPPRAVDAFRQARDVHLAAELRTLAADDQQAYGVASDIDGGDRAHGRWGRPSLPVPS